MVSMRVKGICIYNISRTLCLSSEKSLILAS